jgi:phosphate-selective porin OprO/OprP
MNKIILSLLFLTHFAKAQSVVSSDEKATAYNFLKTIQLNGFLHFRYQEFEDSTRKDGFDLRRARLDLNKEINKNWSFRLQLEAAGNGVRIFDANINYHPLETFSITAGQFKLPFSAESLEQAVKLNFINRSQAVEALVARGKDVLGNYNGRDIGIQVAGNILKTNDHHLIDYYLGVFNGQGINTSDANSHKDICGRLVVHPVKNLVVAGSIYVGYDQFLNESHNSKRNRNGIDITYTANKWSLYGEYVSGDDAGTTKEGFAASATYFIYKKKLASAFRFDYYDGNTTKPESSSIWYIAGLNYYISDTIMLMANYDYRTEENTNISNNLFHVQLQVQY